MVKIGDIELRGNLTLAPMAGVTDFAFRRVCRGLGAALTTTEMVSAKALVYKDEKTKALLYIPEDEHPCAAQIFGHEPDVMAEAAVMAREISGADIIDINMGCPVGKVVKSGDGSALMRTPELAEEIIRSVVKSAGLPRHGEVPQGLGQRQRQRRGLCAHVRGQRRSRCRRTRQDARADVRRARGTGTLSARCARP